MEVTPRTQLLHFDQCSRPEYRTSGWGCVGGDGGYDEGASLTLDSSVTWKPHAHPGRLSCDRDLDTELDTHEGDGDGDDDDDGRIPIRHAVAGLDSISCAEEQAGAGSRNRWTEEQEEAVDRRAQEAEQEVEGEEEFIADSGSGGDGLMDRSNSVSSTPTSLSIELATPSPGLRASLPTSTLRRPPSPAPTSNCTPSVSSPLVVTNLSSSQEENCSPRSQLEVLPESLPSSAHSSPQSSVSSSSNNSTPQKSTQSAGGDGGRIGGTRGAPTIKRQLQGMRKPGHRALDAAPDERANGSSEAVADTSSSLVLSRVIPTANGLRPPSRLNVPRGAPNPPSRQVTTSLHDISNASTSSDLTNVASTARQSNDSIVDGRLVSKLPTYKIGVPPARSSTTVLPKSRLARPVARTVTTKPPNSSLPVPSSRLPTASFPSTSASRPASESTSTPAFGVLTSEHGKPKAVHPTATPSSSAHDKENSRPASRLQAPSVGVPGRVLNSGMKLHKPAGVTVSGLSKVSGKPIPTPALSAHARPEEPSGTLPQPPPPSPTSVSLPLSSLAENASLGTPQLTVGVQLTPPPSPNRPDVEAPASLRDPPPSREITIPPKPLPIPFLVGGLTRSPSKIRARRLASPKKPPNIQPEPSSDILPPIQPSPGSRPFTTRIFSNPNRIAASSTSSGGVVAAFSKTLSRTASVSALKAISEISGTTSPAKPHRTGTDCPTTDDEFGGASAGDTLRSLPTASDAHSLVRPNTSCGAHESSMDAADGSAAVRSLRSRSRSVSSSVISPAPVSDALIVSYRHANLDLAPLPSEGNTQRNDSSRPARRTNRVVHPKVALSQLQEAVHAASIPLPPSPQRESRSPASFAERDEATAQAESISHRPNAQRILPCRPPSIPAKKLLELTTLNTKRNKENFNTLSWVTIDVNGPRPPSPTSKIRRSSNSGRPQTKEECKASREERAAKRRANRASLDECTRDNLTAELSFLEDDEDDNRVTEGRPAKGSQESESMSELRSRHFRAPGDDEDGYESPVKVREIFGEVAMAQAIRSQNKSKQASAKIASKPLKVVRWDRGLVSADPPQQLSDPVRAREKEAVLLADRGILRPAVLDNWGNAPKAAEPISPSVARAAVRITKMIYSDDK